MAWKSWLTSALTALLLGKAAVAGTWQEHRLSAKALTEYGSRYLVHLPDGYDQDPQKKWPVIVCLHGMGEWGDDFALVKQRGLAAYLDDGHSLAAIVLVPQTPAQQRWHPLFVNAVMEDAAGQLRFDPTRIYLTGMSMGAMGSWAMAVAYPHRFAAMAPIAGCIPNDIIADSFGHDLPEPALLLPALGRIKALPVWVFHGDADFTVATELGQRSADLFNQAGGQAKLTLYPKVGHDSWTKTYSESSGLFPWLLAQTAPAPQWDAPRPPLDPRRYTGRYLAPSGAELTITAVDAQLKLTWLNTGESERLLTLDETHFTGWEWLQFEPAPDHMQALLIPGQARFSYTAPAPAPAPAPTSIIPSPSPSK